MLSAESADRLTLPLQRPAGGGVPLSYGQHRLWFLDQLDRSRTDYVIPWAVRIRGALAHGPLGRAVNEIIGRHDILRTRFILEGDMPVQVVDPASPVAVPIHDLADLAGVAAVLADEGLRPFDLSRGPLIRVQLLRFAEDDHVLTWTVHHIVFDGFSQRLFCGELAVLYQAFLHGDPSPLSPLPMQYADFALWERQAFHDGGLREGLEFWAHTLANMPNRLALPTDRPRPLRQQTNADGVTAVFGPQLVDALKEVCRSFQTTLSTIMLATYAAVLSRHTGQDDVVIGIPVADRPRREVKDLIGFFVNSLPIRIRVGHDSSLADLLRHVREVSLMAYVHRHVPFERLVKHVAPHRSLDATPIFQTTLSFQRSWRPSSTGDLTVEQLGKTALHVRTDLEIHMHEGADTIKVTWLYATALFDEWRIRQMMVHFERMLMATIANAGQLVADVRLLDADEERLLLAGEC